MAMKIKIHNPQCGKITVFIYDKSETSIYTKEIDLSNVVDYTISCDDFGRAG